MDKIVCQIETHGFTVGKEYPAVLKTHCSLRINGSLVQPTIARCVETAADTGEHVLFTETPSASWHQPYQKFIEKFEVCEAELGGIISRPEFNLVLRLFEKESSIILRPAQQDVCFSALNRKNVLIHGETGVGKTLVGVFLAWYAWRIKRRRVLVVAPRSLCAGWSEALGKAGMAFEGGVEVWSNTQVTSSLFPKLTNAWEVLLDEAHWLTHLPKDPILFVDATAAAHRKTAFTATPERVEDTDRFAIYGWLLVPDWAKGKISEEFPYPIYDKSNYRPDSKVLKEHTLTLTLDSMRKMPPLNIYLIPKVISQPGRARKYARAEVAARIIAKEHKWTLVFANEIHQLIYMGDALAKQGISCVTITGETENPQQILNEFNSRRCSILLMTASMGVGLSVETAERVIFLETPKGAVQLNQCLGRAYRLTTDHPVDTFFFEDETAYLPTLLGFVNDSRKDLNLTPLELQVLPATENSA